jgi:DNA-binding transcriptional ArsR family regulator
MRHLNDTDTVVSELDEQLVEELESARESSLGRPLVEQWNGERGCGFRFVQLFDGANRTEPRGRMDAGPKYEVANPLGPLVICERFDRDIDEQTGEVREEQTVTDIGELVLNGADCFGANDMVWNDVLRALDVSALDRWDGYILAAEKDPLADGTVFDLMGEVKRTIERSTAEAIERGDTEGISAEGPYLIHSVPVDGFVTRLTEWLSRPDWCGHDRFEEFVRAVVEGYRTFHDDVQTDDDATVELVVEAGLVGVSPYRQDALRHILFGVFESSPVAAHVFAAVRSADGMRTQTQLGEEFGISQSTVSRHLDAIRDQLTRANWQADTAAELPELRHTVSE